jgi:hypothetical protein
MDDGFTGMMVALLSPLLVVILLELCAIEDAIKHNHADNIACRSEGAHP